MKKVIWIIGIMAILVLLNHLTSQINIELRHDFKMTLADNLYTLNKFIYLELFTLSLVILLKEDFALFIKEKV
jgi:hypothetical protein